jgi:hypothetical protein
MKRTILLAESASGYAIGLEARPATARWQRAPDA